MGPIVTAVKKSIEFAVFNETHFNKDPFYTDLIDMWKSWISCDKLSRAQYENWRSCDVDSDSSIPRYKVSITVKNYFDYAEPGEYI